MLADRKGFMLHRGMSGRGVSGRVLDVEQDLTDREPSQPAEPLAITPLLQEMCLTNKTGCWQREF